MIGRVKKKQGKRTTDKTDLSVKPVFGSFAFDYFKTCQHKLSGHCVMCTLVTTMVRDHFEKERIEREDARIQSKKNRAIMRYGILEDWSKCQLKSYENVTQEFVVEFSLCGSLIRCLDSLLKSPLKNKSSFHLLINLLKRRRRIMEIGYYAAQFVQCRIRKHVCKKFLRRLWLKRFEYIPANSFRGDFFLDTMYHRKCKKYPFLLKNERPNTPRTIGRRLSYEENRREKRYKTYSSLATSEENSRDFWSDEDNQILCLRQLALFRDELAIGASFLTSVAAHKYRHLIDLQESQKNKSSQDRRNKKKSINGPVMAASMDDAPVLKSIAQCAETSSDTLSSLMSPPNFPCPMWMNFTSPAPSYRQVSLSLALATPSLPSPSEEEEKLIENIAAAPMLSSSSKSPSISNRKSIIAAKSPSKSGSPLRNSVGDSSLRNNTPSSPLKNRASVLLSPMSPTSNPNVGSTLSIMAPPIKLFDSNNRLQRLEQLAWDCLLCCRPEDAIEKLLCEEIQPSLASAVNFAEDEYEIWIGKRMFHKDRNEAEIDQMEVEETSESSQVLPMALQLRPLPEERGPHCIFKLFFMDQELLLISQASPWCYYVEILTNRDAILQSIKALVNSEGFQKMMHGYYEKANENSHGGGSSDSHSVHSHSSSIHSHSSSQRSAPMSSFSSSKKEASTPVDCFEDVNVGAAINFYVPEEDKIFAKLEHRTNLFHPRNDELNQLHYSEYYYSQEDLSKIRNFYHLTDDAVLRLNQEYNVPIWKDRLKRAQNNIKARRKAAQDQKSTLKDKGKNVNPAPVVTPSVTKNVPISKQWLKKCFDDQKFVLGEEIHKSYYLDGTTPITSNPSNNSTSKSSNNDASKKDSAPTYRELLESLMTSTDTLMSNRMNPPDCLPPPNKHYDVFIVDVCVNLRQPRDITSMHSSYYQNKEKEKTLSKPSSDVDVKNGLNASSGGAVSLTSNGNNSNNSSNNSINANANANANASANASGVSRRGPNTNSSTLNQGVDGLSLSSLNQITATLHCVVGIFSSSNEKAPPNVDFGLFDWENFQDYHKQKMHHQSYFLPNLHRSISNNAGGGKKGPSWSAPDPSSGKCFFRSLLSSNNEFVFQILGDEPSMEYLEQTLPKKIKSWIGMP